MPQNYAALVALFPFALAPAWADAVAITAVAVNGSVTGSGSVSVRCDSCPGGAGEGGFSFAGSNTQVGTFSKSVQGSFTDISGRSATVSGSAEQATAASATSVGVDFQDSAIFDGVGAEWSALASLSNQYTLGFTLTTQSLMRLSGSGGMQWYLSGAGLNIGPLFGPFDQTFTADPGDYMLTVSDMMNLIGQPSPIGGGASTHFEQTDQLSLTADFTPIVPEPRWTVGLLASFLILCHFVSCRRREQK